MPTLKLGIVGAGFAAQFHARAIQQVRNIEIAGITALKGAEALSAFVKHNHLGKGTVYPNVSELAKHVEAIALFIPNYVRLELVEQIVEEVKKGANLKGMIIEKPLARNMQEARRLVELVTSAGIHNAYYENQIFMKPIRSQMAQLAPQQRTMGPLVLARSAEEHGGPHEPWFWDPIRQGGGVLSDMGCHSIAIGCTSSLRPASRSTSSNRCQCRLTPPCLSGVSPIGVKSCCARGAWIIRKPLPKTSPPA